MRPPLAWRITALLLVLLLAPAPLAGAASKKWIEWTISETIGDARPEYAFLGGRRLVTLDVIQRLDKAREDDSIAGLLLRIRRVPMGWARIQEIRDLLAGFRSSGKPVVAHGEALNMTAYYLATAADQIFVSPLAPLDVRGLASEALFFRGTLDLLGITPELLHIGEYKSASDHFTQKGFTKAHREVTESLVDDLLGQWIAGVAERRGKTPDEVRALLDRGPLLAGDAKAEGLVDGVLHEDEVVTRIRAGSADRVKLEDYEAKRRGLLGLSLEPERPKIAVVAASGLIWSGKSEAIPGIGRVLGSDTVVKVLRDLATDDRVKAIVLRIDSPGGSGLASDLVWREIESAKRRKPLVVHMSDVAGSGGYYIAMGAHRIFAEPATLTGSIGVVSGKFSLAGLYEKIGVDVAVVSRGRRAELFTTTRAWTDEERRIAEEQMRRFYEDFVAKAAAARHRSFEEIERVARGRVWTGKQAASVGLVDELGGLSRAIAHAKEKAGITDAEIVEYPKPKGLGDFLRDFFGGGGNEPWLAASLPAAPPSASEALAAFARARLLEGGRVLAVMPAVPVVR